MTGNRVPDGARSADPVTPEEDDNLLFSVWLVSRSTGDLLDRALAPAGLSADEFGIYSVLAATPAITPTELARWMAARATTVSSHVRRMEERGHLERQRNAEDGRSHVLRLTPSGRSAHARASSLFGPALDLVRQHLGGQQDEVHAALLRLRSALDGAREVLDRLS
jgi:DNA-binding MarR family transcriptional regulator